VAPALQEPEPRVDDCREHRDDQQKLTHDSRVSVAGKPVRGKAETAVRPAADYPGGVKEFAIYTLSRLGIFLASYALVVGIYLLVTGGQSVPFLWPFLTAAVLSAVASIVLLRGQRERFAAVVQRRAEAASRRFEAARAKEDEPEA
jgi:hypothetical protein